MGNNNDDIRPERPRDLTLDYKDTKTLKRFLSEGGKILPRRRTGLTAKEQRQCTTEIKRARHLALLPFTSRD